MSKWFQEHRIAWIAEMVGIYGFINRGHVMKKFDVSQPQASRDLQDAIKRHPGLMRYNMSAKRYEISSGL
ncbi:hypothetical protein [Sinorhizobium meliloti]|uniref:hypothetical protein n=1 Tax=Rhizobium meliloti TaxID=382 RepID=UPI003F190B80